ncbi:MAG: hypothetical protein IJ072_07570 [Oscillospiraceae bacterium]|nr:hypothetical protein [Oscillospiraceae bacterium]
MNEKIALNIFYAAIAAAVISLIACAAVVYSSARRQADALFDRQTQTLAQIYDSYGAQGVGSAVPEGLFIQLTDGAGDVSQFGEKYDGSDLCERTITLHDGGALYVAGRGVGISQCYGPLAVIILAIAALSAAAAALRAKAIVRPVRELSKSLERDITDAGAQIPYPELEPIAGLIQSSRTSGKDMRQEFTANVTHELKTPLTSISGYAEMISNGMAKPHDVKRFADKIQTESDRMLTLVNDILELSKLDDEEKIESPEPVELFSLAMECADQLSASAEKRGISIDVTGSPTTVMGDEGKLWELIYNLADNAIRYNHDGGRVDIEVKDRRVTIRDTGIGISPEHQKRIFERFYRVDKSHSRATGGTGLGLSIVKHIAELHHGRITVKSELNAGTEITVDFT